MRMTLPGGNSPLTPPATDIAPQLRDDLLTLVHRGTFGFTQEELERARSMGFDAWLEEQLDPDSIEDSATDQLLATLPTLQMSGAQLLSNYPPQNNGDLVVAQELLWARLWRARSSRRQLYERVVEFWTDHFNIHQADNALRWLKTVDDREVIRTHALGNFRDLLGASAKSGAMLLYLDNATSVSGAPNENYSRELMELHTLGSDGGYSETDVQEVARCFTGWSIFPLTSPNATEFLFRPQEHDNQSKFVLETSIPAGGGQQDGETVLDLLATHPSTAHHLARKLCVFFLVYDPPQVTVQRVADAFLASSGDIRTTLRAVLSPQSFAETSAWGAYKLKRPLQFTISALRAMDAQLNLPSGLVGELLVMGHRPYDWPAPNGYPDSLGAWGSNVLPRWDFASRLLDGSITGTEVPNAAIAALVGDVPTSEVATTLNRRMSGGRLSPEDMQEVQSFVDAQPNLDVSVAREAIALVLSMPSFQWL